MKYRSLALFSNFCLITGLVCGMGIRLTAAFETNRDLMEHLKNSGYIVTRRVEWLMEAVDRARFIEGGERKYEDAPRSIGYRVTMSAPHMHAVALEQMLPHLGPGSRVLDVGSGTGYLTACLAKQIGGGGLVIGIDHIEELVRLSIENVKKVPGMAEYLQSGSLQFRVGDGREGLAELGPYDAIHVGAAAESVPEKLVNQLKPGGILICPIGPPEGSQFLAKVTKLQDGSSRVEHLMGVRYVPLTDKTTQLRTEL